MRKETHNWRIGLFVFIVLVIFIYLVFFSLIENVALRITSITGLAVENQPPQLTDIPDIAVDEDGFYLLNLNPYVEDDNTSDSEIGWSHSKLKNLAITIYQNKTAKISGKQDWNGEEDVTFTAIDEQGLNDSENITVTVTPTNDAPEITYFTPSSLTPILEETFEIHFEVEAEDTDGDGLMFKWYFDNSLKSSNGSIWSYSAASDDIGNHTVNVLVSDGKVHTAHHWVISVIKLKTPPVLVGDIPNQEWEMNTNLTQVFDLDDYFDDLENHSMVYSFEGNENIIIKINMSNNKPNFYPKKDWFGDETVRFIADDGDLIKKSNNVILKVKKPVPCTELWNCTIWQPEECPENKTQKRVCYDLNNCGTKLKKPSEIGICMSMPKENESKNKVDMLKEQKDQNKTTEKTSVYETGIIELSPIDKLKKSKTMLFIISVLILSGMLAFIGFEKSRSEKMLSKERKLKKIENSSLLRLTDYIIKELHHGLTGEQIRTKLLYEGWNEYVIEKAFSQLVLIKRNTMKEKEGGIEAMMKKDAKKEIHEKMRAFEK